VRKSIASRRAKKSVEGIAGKEKIVYLIKKGNTLGEISKKYGVRVSDLRIWNDIAYGHSIKAGESLTLWIPSAKAAKFASEIQPTIAGSKNNRQLEAAQGESSNNTNGKWTKIRVKRGDSLGKIAKRYGVTIADLKKWNKLADNTVVAGSKLSIQVQGESKDSTAALVAAKKDSANAALLKSYTVKKGDTLFAIASMFGVSVEDLKTWNKIRGNRIKVGQEIKINS